MKADWSTIRNRSLAAVAAALLVGGWIYYSRGHTVETGRTVIRIWDWWNPAGSERLAEFFEKIEADFEARHPEIDVRYQFIPFGSQYVQKLMSAMAAGNPPDAFQCSIIWATDLYDRGVIRDLDDLIADSPEVGPDAWFPICMQYISRDGRVFGLPTSMDAYALLVNTEMAREAGLDPSPWAIKSWEGFAEYADKLTIRRPDGTVKRAGFLLSVTGERFSAMLPWLAAEGKDFLTADLLSTNVDTPEGLAAMNFMYDLLHKYNVALPPGMEQQDQALFFERKAAMMMGGTWQGYHILQKAPGLEFVMTNLPPGPHGDARASVTWANMMMMPKNCLHPRETWEFLKYYCGLENAINMLEILSRNSPRKDFYATPEWRAAVAEYPFLETVPEICASGRTYPYKRFEEVNDTFLPYFQKALLGTMPTDEAMREGTAAAERVLAGNWADRLLRESAGGAPGRGANGAGRSPAPVSSRRRRR